MKLEGWREEGAISVGGSVITMAPSGCWEVEITSDFEVKGNSIASVAIVTRCVCMYVNSLGGLLCMIHTVTCPDSVTVLLLI